MSNGIKNNWHHLALWFVAALLVMWASCLYCTGCIEPTAKSDNDFVGPPYVAGDSTQKVDASSSLVTAKMLEDAKIELRSEVAAQINKVGGDQNSSWVFAMAIASGPLTVFLDKVSRRSKTVRKIDAAFKGHKRVTVSE